MAHAGPCNFNHILTDENERQKLCTWFWNSSNGNDLTAVLNSSCHSSGSKIRRCDGWWPHIYCVVSNENNVPGISRNGETEWKYCKVGDRKRYNYWDEQPNGDSRKGNKEGD